MRNNLRKQRRSVNKARAYRASISALHHLLKNNILKHRNIAIYSDSDGELPTRRIINFLLQQGRDVYLPVLNNDRLAFAQINKQRTTYRRNRFGIFEPRGTKRLHAKQISLVITPLVGFDAYGNRLGMGGGFYDKTFSFKHQQTRFDFPKMYGLAYDFQKTIITPNPWDIRLNKIITQTYSLKCK